MIKQAQRLQQMMGDVKDQLGRDILEVSKGGGAVHVKVNGHGEFLDLKVDADFLKEDHETVQSTLLEAVREATLKARTHSEQKMSSLTAGLGIPGL